MRSIKLTAASAAAALLLTLAPAAAPAAGRHSGHRIRHAAPGNCRATLDVAPRLITAGESVVAYGHLSCPSAAERENQTVTLYEGTAPGDTVAGKGTTNEKGFYTIETAHLTSNSSFHVVAGSTQSRNRSVRVAAQVTLSGPTEGAQLVAGRSAVGGEHVTFTGTVSPEKTGALLVLQRQDATTGNEWHRIQLGRVRAGGSFTITHTFVLPGDANIRVLVRSPRHNVASPSNVLAYEISQAQNPSLTINASADPIAFGQSVTITGTAAAAPSTTLTLLAHTARQGPFAPVAEVKTDAGGHYEFSAQSPVHSSFYEVQGDGRTSATLYENVGDALLSTTVSPGSSIQAGETVTFSGAVSPERPGHVIYLERQNTAGSGLHVVEVSTLSSSSTYSIAHTIYTAGASVFRVRIPGDPQNGGAVSPAFTIQVTPASSASALTPEAPGNSTLPPEGQV